MISFTILGAHGVRILQQTVAMRRSNVRITRTHDDVHMETINIDRLQLYEPYVRPVNWRRKSVYIDGTDLGRIKGISQRVFVTLLPCYFYSCRPAASP